MANNLYEKHVGDALVAVFKTASVVVIGYLFAVTGNVSRAFRNGMFKILVTLLLPFFVFVTVAENITEQNVLGLGFVALACTFQLTAGLLVGWVWMKVFDPPKVIRIVAVVSTAMGNWFEITVALCLFLDGKSIFKKEAFNGQLAIAYTTASISLFRMFLAYVFEITFTPLSSPSGRKIIDGIPTSILDGPGNDGNRNPKNLSSFRLSTMRPWSFDESGWNGTAPNIAPPKPTADGSASITLMSARSSSSVQSGKRTRDDRVECIRAENRGAMKVTEVRDVPPISRQISKASSVTKFVRSSMHQLKGRDRHSFYQMEEEPEIWLQMCEDVDTHQNNHQENLAVTDATVHVEEGYDANINPFGPDDTMYRIGNINPFKKKKRRDALKRMLKDMTGMGGAEGSGSKGGHGGEIPKVIREDGVEAIMTTSLHVQRRGSKFWTVISALFHPINIAFALGTIVAVTPLKNHLVTSEVETLTRPHKIITSIYDVVLFVSQSAVPIGLLHLGTSLHIPSNRRFVPPTLGPMCLGTSILARLLILPMIAMIATRCLDGVLAPDPALKFAMMATGCGPTALWGMRVNREPMLVDEEAEEEGMETRTKRGIGMINFLLIQHLCSCASLVLQVSVILWII